MNPADIKIVFTLEQVNAVLQYLGNLPYAQVAELINGIKTIATPQVPAQPAEESEGTETVQ